MRNIKIQQTTQPNNNQNNEIISSSDLTTVILCIPVLSEQNIHISNKYNIWTTFITRSNYKTLLTIRQSYKTTQKTKKCVNSVLCVCGPCIRKASMSVEKIIKEYIGTIPKFNFVENNQKKKRNLKEEALFYK